MDLYKIVLCYCLCSTVYSKTEETSLTVYQETGYCTLNSTKNISSCTSAEGKLIEVKTPLTVPPFGICRFQNGLTVVDKQCLRDGHFQELGTSVDRHVRHKRFFADSLHDAVLYHNPDKPDVARFFGFIGVLFDIVTLWCFGFCANVKFIPPPFVSCKLKDGANTIIEAPKGKQEASVEVDFGTREGDDIKKKIFCPSKASSPMNLPSGYYTVYCTAVNGGGAVRTESVSFQVKVIRCGKPTSPENGELECDCGVSYYYGCTCKVKCRSGYQLDPFDKNKEVLTCMKVESDGIWNSLTPHCKAKPCKPSPVITHGHLDCGVQTENTFETKCTVVCNENNGYQLFGNRHIKCDADGIWGTPGICKGHIPNVKPPEFEYCPTSLTVNIDSPDNTAAVSWTVIPTDNSNEPLVVKEIHNYTPGQRFVAGKHSVQYDIQDASGNVGPSCLFDINVLTISCDHPHLSVNGSDGSEHMMYECPDFYRLGAECKLSCSSGYPLVGVTTIQCQNQGNADPPMLEWKWDGLDPYCRVTACPDLAPPENGALACDLWDHGNVCQMQCQRGFDIPYMLRENGLYVCGRSNGKWRPEDKVPNCIPIQNAIHVNAKLELFFYTGVCNSSKENLHEIQENFIKALNSSKWFELCTSKCQSRFVNVTCGPVTSIYKREANAHLNKRQAENQLAYRIEFELIVPFVVENNVTPLEAFAQQETVLYNMIDAVQKEVDSGHFDIPVSDLHIESDSLGIGRPTLSCEKGEVPRLETGTCVGCPTGRYLSLQTNDCVFCDIGTYQDSPGSLSCKDCPGNTNTTEKGSRNITQCLEYCSPGSFSETGLSPCQLCPSSTYQPESYQTSCLKCGTGLRTAEEGNVSPENCKPYDISVAHENQAQFYMKKSATDMTISTWIFLQDKQRNTPVFSISTPNDKFNFDITFNTSVVLDINGQETNFLVHLPEKEWIPVALTINTLSKEANMYVDGSLKSTEQIIIPRSEIIQQGDILKIHSGVILSSFMVIDSVLPASDITTLSSSCTSNLQQAIYKMDDIAALSAATVTIPSICDAVNECKSSPCGNHTCLNKLDGYECVCHGGFSGKKCQVPPDFCIGHSCSDGSTCISLTNSYSCKCAYGFKGALCETKAVDGGWSSWSSWSSCSMTCGGGFSSRERQCNNPFPEPEGQPCKGLLNETIHCNNNTCPECRSLLRPYGVQMNCNNTDLSRRCEISCRTGLFFATETLPYYECGVITNYKWNHETEENPTARLPACTEAKPPTHMSVSFQGHYDSVECNSENIQTIRNEISSSMGSLECMKHGSCTSSDVHGKCEGKERQKRSSGPGIGISLSLNTDVVSDGSGYSLEELLTNLSAPTSDLTNLLKHAVELDLSAKTIINESSDFFEVSIRNVKHTLANGSLQYSASLRCPPGSIPVDIFCAECPVGCYSNGTAVIMCPVGQYQDESGQSYCKQCPRGYTTAGVGSSDITECSVTEDIVFLKEAGEDGPNVVHITVGVVVPVSVLLIAAFIAVFYYKYKGKGQNKVSRSYDDLAMRDVYAVDKPVFDKRSLSSQDI